jgi:hypothetical protein
MWTEHVRLAAKYRGGALPTSLEFQELDKLLLARALEHDSPTDLRHPPHAHQLKP